MTESIENWRNVKNSNGDIFGSINHSFFIKQHVIPSFKEANTLVIGSDYSGESQADPFLVYSFLITDWLSWCTWDSTRLLLRSRILPDNRRMSYKKLGDSYRGKMLKPMLEASDEVNGMLLSIAINKKAPSIFSENGPIDLHNPDFIKFRNWKPVSLEKAFIITRIIGLLLAGMGRPGQNIFWFTDQDQIASNSQMLEQLTKVFSWVTSNYLDFDLGHLRCGTTACDNGSLQIEDFVSVPDLVAGALCEHFRRTTNTTLRDPMVMWMTGAGLKDKAQQILFWLGTRQRKLKKHVFVIDPDPNNADTGYMVSWFNYGEGEPNI